MNTKQQIVSLLRAHGLSPAKYKGQHFLINQKDLKDIASYAEIISGEKIVEIGAGVGNLTEVLIADGADIVAVEKDEALAAILSERFREENIEVINTDILAFDESSLNLPYKVVGNIPYYITGPIIRKFLQSSNQPALVVLTIQKEVGERIVAEPPRATFLSNMVRLYGQAEINKSIPADHFWPKPKVDSVIISITPSRPTKDAENLLGLIKQGFRQPRKTLLNNLTGYQGASKEKVTRVLEKLGLDKRARAHELSLKDWEVFSRISRKEK